jgi:hypothetical protein
MTKAAIAIIKKNRVEREDNPTDTSHDGKGGMCEVLG